MRNKVDFPIEVNTMRRLLGGVVALGILVGSVSPLPAGEFSIESKPGHRHVQGGKKKHALKKAAKAVRKSAKQAAKKASKGKKHHRKIKV
jgi:hypothetical protein